MDMLMVDVTELPNVRPGDEVTLFGRDGEAYLPVEEIAQACGTIPYEILCDLSPRVKRVYVRAGTEDAPGA